MAEMICSNHVAWRELMVRRLGPEGLFDVVRNIEREGLFNNWSRTSTPVSTLYFDFAIDLLCGAPEQVELIATFLGYIRQQVERAQSEPQRWDMQEPSSAWGHPFMKATRWYDLQRSDLYSRALLGEAFVVEPRHFQALQGAAADWAALKGRDWNELFQSYYIECALVAAAWGDLTQAQALLKPRRSYKYTQHYIDWSRALVEQLLALAPGEAVAPESPLWSHFHAFFDQVRHPTLLSRQQSTRELRIEAAKRGEYVSASSRALWRLVLAMIKQRYLLARPIEPGLRSLITLISE